MASKRIQVVQRGELVLVTGASSGIGRAFAERFAQAEARLALVARNKAALEQTAAGLRGNDHVILDADLTNPSGRSKVTEFINSHRVRVFINNAGCGRYGTFHLDDWKEQDPIMELNCHAAAYLAHIYLRTAIRGDALVNVSSVAACLPQPTSAMYAASKAFITSLSEALWFENKPRDVHVLALHPGITRTQFRERSGGKTAYGKGTQEPHEVVTTAMRALMLREGPSITCGTGYKIITRFLAY